MLPAVPFHRNGVLTAPPTLPHVYTKCWFCEPDFGEEADECEGMLLLNSLSYDLEMHQERVGEEDVIISLSPFASRPILIVV
jgi:hypothetical protein